MESVWERGPSGRVTQGLPKAPYVPQGGLRYPYPLGLPSLKNPTLDKYMGKKYYEHHFEACEVEDIMAIIKWMDREPQSRKPQEYSRNVIVKRI